VVEILHILRKSSSEDNRKLISTETQNPALFLRYGVFDQYHHTHLNGLQGALMDMAI